MALAGRPTRRSGAGLRWLAVGLVITLFVLLIDASLKSRSPSQVQQMAAGVWVDRVLPLITSSNADGQELAGVWADGLSQPPAVTAGLVASVAADSARSYDAVSKLGTPVGLGGAAGLLEASLLSRSKAAGLVQSAFDQILGPAVAGPGPDVVPKGRSTTTTVPPAAVNPVSVLPSLQTAASDIALSDQAYALFLSAVPASLGVKFPPSTWGGDLAPYQPQAAEVFLTTLQSRSVTTPVDKVSILSVTTDPAPVATAPDGSQVLPDARAITVTIVIADTGNRPENNLTVTASISPAGAAASARDFVNLGVGQAYTIQGLGPLDPPQGVPVTLTVKVTGPAAGGAGQAGGGPAGAGGGLAPVSQTLVFSMPAPPPPSTTSTTAAGSGSGSSSLPRTSTTSATTPPSG